MNELNLLRTGDPESRYTLLLAHGAGANMRSSFMETISERIVAKCNDDDTVQVIRFDFPYMEEQRRKGNKRPPDRLPVLEAHYHRVIDTLLNEGVEVENLFIGGKSMGGRVASLIADQCQVAGLACLGYPFHPTGKPEKPRTAHLETLNTPTLICQGERDTMGRPEEVADYRLASTIHLHWLSDGDHSFKPRKASGLSEMDNLDEAATAVARFIGRQG